MGPGYSWSVVKQQAAFLSRSQKVAVHHELSVTVQVDLDGCHIRMIGTGCLIEASQRALYLLIRRACTFTPGVHLTVDLLEAHHLEAAAVEYLREAIDQDISHRAPGPVELVLPDPLPHHRLAIAPMDPVADDPITTGEARKAAA
jgi:hypothetical protein